MKLYVVPVVSNRPAVWLDIDLKTKLDLAKYDNDRVRALVQMAVLMLDEVSMRTRTADASLKTQGARHRLFALAPK